MTGEKTSEKKIPENAGVDPIWLESLVRKDLGEPIETTERELNLISAKPKSQMQSYLQGFYFELLDTLKEIRFDETGGLVDKPGEDIFSDWYKDNGIEKYSQMYKLFSFFNTIARGVSVQEESGWGKQEEFGKLLSRIAQRCIEEPEYVQKIADIINQRYPNLVSPFRTMPSVEEVNKYNQQEYQRKVRDIQEQIQSNIGKFQGKLERIEAAKKTDIEQLARQLNNIVIVGDSIWELVLYGLMSPRAPRMIMNNLDYRACIHVMLAGDISTAKSKIHKICKMISPKMVVVDDMTKPALEGVYKIGEGIQDGIIDQAQNGNIIMEEFDPKFSKMTMFRRIMDCEFIETHKGGDSKGVYVNTQFLTACNPNDDFFMEETSFRSQLNYKEGILSRFDILVPLTATQVKNEMLMDKMHIMTGELPEAIDFEDIKTRLTTLAGGMEIIKRVMITKEQEQSLKAVFRDHNQVDKQRRLLKNRPLVLLRDLEILGRFVNIIATINFSKRNVDGATGILWANDEDIDKAISLWENLLAFRVQLYEQKGNRNLMTISDEIVVYIHKASKEYEDSYVPRMTVKQCIVNERALCSESTFYEEWKKLKEDGRIVQKGERDAKAQVVIR